VASGSAEVSARRKFAGVARDASDGVLKFFKDATTKPTSTINFSEAGLGFADIRVSGINASGTVALPSTTSIGDVSSTEIGYLDGVTSSIQTQITNKQNTVANVSDTEISYLDGVTSGIQTQLNAKAATADKLSVFAATTSSELAGVISDETGSGVLVFGTSPTIGTPAITGGTLTDAVVRGLEEDVNVVASAATGTINFNVETASIWYYTSNSSANHTVNFRYSSSVSLDTALSVGDSITLVWLNTNGVTAYYPNVIQVDGSAVTPKWQGGTAPTGGNASSIDAYTFTIIKTASATFTLLASQTKFA
jgi:hypothetical protein